MTDTSPLPPGWRAVAAPSGWDPEEPELRIRPVHIEARYVTVPDDFLMVIQTKEMIDKEQPTAIIVGFRASKSEGVKLVRIIGMGADWADYLGEVVQKFPPAAWAMYAEGAIVDFLRRPEIRKAVAADVTPLPLPEAENLPGQSLEPGVQRRRKITREHLEEVARVYNEAQAKDEPPTRAVQHHFNVSHSTAAKWVGTARRNDLLPPVESAAD